MIREEVQEQEQNQETQGPYRTVQALRSKCDFESVDVNNLLIDSEEATEAIVI